jgi:hypothetical protein
VGKGLLRRSHHQPRVHRRRRRCRRPVYRRRHERRAIRFTETDRAQNVSGVLRSLSLRQARANCVGRLLLRSIHAVDSARTHRTARRRSLSNEPKTNLPSQKARGIAPFPRKIRDLHHARFTSQTSRKAEPRIEPYPTVLYCGSSKRREDRRRPHNGKDSQL